MLASAAVAIRVAATSGPEAQAASGMYAFGDAFLFVAAFSVFALIPTGAALFFLRSYRQFWVVLSTIALVVAATSVIAMILYATGRQAANSSLATWASASVLRMLVAPFLALAFFVSAWFPLYRFARLALLASAAMESLVCAYAGIVWFLPLLFHR